MFSFDPVVAIRPFRNSQPSQGPNPEYRLTNYSDSAAMDDIQKLKDSFAKRARKRSGSNSSPHVLTPAASSARIKGGAYPGPRISPHRRARRRSESAHCSDSIDPAPKLKRGSKSFFQSVYNRARRNGDAQIRWSLQYLHRTPEQSTSERSIHNSSSNAADNNLSGNSPMRIARRLRVRVTESVKIVEALSTTPGGSAEGGWVPGDEEEDDDGDSTDEEWSPNDILEVCAAFDGCY